ncbi:MAG: hypothetical protein QHH24_04180 [Candidatus Bathyarchaeota archaeon]|nr:hypothetical protein [Candidatus Bathyarchaeota archaeon]
MSRTSAINHTKTTITLLLTASITGLIIGIALGIQLYQISTTKLGFWRNNVESTTLTVLQIRHQIQDSTKIRTTVQLGNTGPTAISCNCTLYYKNSAGVSLATHSFNITLTAGQIKTESMTITPIDVAEFAGTDLSVYEY